MQTLYISEYNSEPSVSLICPFSSKKVVFS